MLAYEQWEATRVSHGSVMIVLVTVWSMDSEAGKPVRGSGLAIVL